MSTRTHDSKSMQEEAEMLDLARSAFQHARAGDTMRLAWLLDAGLPVDLTNERGDTLLMLASYHGREEATRLLLTRGARGDRANDLGQTPLAGAAFKGNVAIARVLLEQGVPVDAGEPDGRTPLMFAAMFDRLEVLELLLQHGARPEHQGVERRTALDYARAMGAERTAARLEALQAGPPGETRQS